MGDIANESNFSCLSPNISSTNVTDSERWMIHESLHYGTPFVAAVISLFFVIAFTWNLFIIITFFVRYQLLKEPANILLLNLAIADFLVSLITMVFSIVTESTREFIFGNSDVVRCRICDTVAVIFMMLISSSLHTLAALSCDRFVLLAFPLKYKSISTPCRAVCVVVGVWIIAFLTSIPPVIGFGEEDFNRNFGFCIPRFTPSSIRGNNFYYIVFLLIEYLIPIIILIVTNIFTVRIVAKFLKRNLVRRRTYRRGRERASDDSNYHKQQTQLVRVFGALLISHIITWSPVIIVVAIIAVTTIQARSINSEIYIFGWICYLTNPVIHPMIESFFVKDLRYQVRKAKKGVSKSLRKAGSTIYKKASNLAFNSEALDAANSEMDDSVTTTKGRYKRRLNRLKRANTETSMEPETDVVSLGQLTPDITRASIIRPLDGSPRPPPSRRITFHGITANNTMEEVKMSPLLVSSRSKPKSTGKDKLQSCIRTETMKEEEENSSGVETVDTAKQGCNGVVTTQSPESGTCSPNSMSSGEASTSF